MAATAQNMYTRTDMFIDSRKEKGKKNIERKEERKERKEKKAYGYDTLAYRFNVSKKIAESVCFFLSFSYECTCTCISNCIF